MATATPRRIIHQLKSPRLLDPRWFNLIRYGAQGQALDEKSIVVEGETLRLENPDEIHLTPGEQVHVCLSLGYIGMETQAEREEYMQYLEAMRNQREAEVRQQRNAFCKEAEAFNATLHVPVKWLSGQKDVLSGLTEHSDGTGMNAATVTHIWLQEDLQDGRLHRKRYDFLCTSTSGNNGKQWAGQTEDWCMDADHNRYQAKVTCKACLKIAEKWRKDS